MKTALVFGIVLLCAIAAECRPGDSSSDKSGTSSGTSTLENASASATSVGVNNTDPATPADAEEKAGSDKESASNNNVGSKYEQSTDNIKPVEVENTVGPKVAEVPSVHSLRAQGDLPDSEENEDKYKNVPTVD